MTRPADAFSPRALQPILAPWLVSPPASPTTAPRLWVAFSGGLDSSVLLHALAALQTELNGELDPNRTWTLQALHLDHGLQQVAADWSRHCTRVCAALDIPLTLRKLHLRPVPGESLEALARAARYRTFAELLAPGDLLATAQHRDDQAETLLLALLRGSGPHGLAAMPLAVPLGAGTLLRPLLGFSRASLADYAHREGIRWIDDPSNGDPAFDRNRLRQQVMPLLRARWPALDRTLARSAAHCAEAAGLLDAFADDALAELAGSRPGTLHIDAVAALPGPRARLVLRRWLMRDGFRPPGQRVLQRIIDEVLPARPDRSPCVAWPGCEVRRYRHDLFALPPLPPLPEPVLCWQAGRSLRLPDGLGELQLPRAVGRMDRLQVCFRREGLRCRQANGPSRALKQVFQAAGVPAWLRPWVPLVLIDGQLGAVAGVSQCDPCLQGLRWQGHPWERFGLLVSD
ncbi:tRNA lysidine(34) synthetase TilS [Thiohalocapsa marina]|uniref:tRNA lysidine(34) synthetase TilS n=1 Tax=Thiohalocapsa marina TaxID=424902 RepID=UPI001FEBD083|nr:tRNA lysidine(34) synthetase TilS [Thiohalocapsa marina]